MSEVAAFEVAEFGWNASQGGGGGDAATSVSGADTSLPRSHRTSERRRRGNGQLVKPNRMVKT